MLNEFDGVANVSAYTVFVQNVCNNYIQSLNSSKQRNGGYSAKVTGSIGV